MAGRGFSLVVVICLGVACRAPRTEQQAAPPAAGDTAGPPGPSTPQVATTGDTVVRGVVAVVGADPLAQVVLGADGRDVALVGSLRAELGALHGAEVEVRGRAVPNPQGTPPHAVEVARYEIVTIGGERPIVGTLEARVDDLWLAGWRLLGAPDELRRAVGAKVWVIGKKENGRLVVQSYGVILAAWK
jgi:hypothetical protein